MTRPVVVVGGGLAGAAAACRLAGAGLPVVVLERDRAPADKICGEFVSAEAIADLDRLGVHAGRLGVPIGAVRLVRNGRVVEARLPFSGVGLSRRVLDAVLLDRAARYGAEVRRGCTVGAVRENEVEVQGQVAIARGVVLLGTGKHDLHAMRRVPARPPQELVGFKTYFHLLPVQAAALAGHVEVILFRDAYAGLQMVEGGRANLCLLAYRDRLRRVGGTWAALLADLAADDPHLARRLDGAADLLERPLTIYRVPYGFLHCESARDPAGVFRLGDQAAVIPSFSGDGMAIALHSAALAADHVVRGRPATEYHRRLRLDVGAQIGRACALQAVGHSAIGQAALMGIAAVWPRALAGLANLTRVPPRALARSRGRDAAGLARAA